MTKELLVSSSAHETKVAVLEDDQLVELYFQRDTDVGLVGGIYKGRVNRVLPGMQSAFVDIGLERDAFLYVSDFFEDSEEYDRVFTEAENRVARLGRGEGAREGITAADSHPVESKPDESSAATETLEPLIAESESEAVTEPYVEQQTHASEETEATGQAAPTSPPESKDYRRRDFGRQRKRGRRFREDRFTRRPESPRFREEEPSSSPSQGLELLPGESLAKYGHAEAPGTLSQDEKEHPGSEESRLDPPAQDASSEALPQAETELKANPEFQDSEEKATFLTPQENPKGAVETLYPVNAQAQPFPAEVTETSRLAALSPEEEAEPEKPLSSFDEIPLQVAKEASEEAAAADDASEPLGTDEEAATADEEVAQPLLERTQEEVEATEPAEQSYTLRESHHRPRMAPRRTRRGRGKFRGHEGRRQESGGGHRPEASRASNHQPLPINELLKEGQEILVQIAKEPLGTKGARITSHIALPGRYLVYMPTITHTGVSRKIASEDERLRLRNIILENKGSLPGGFIVRTAGAGRSEEEFKADLGFLGNLWNEIRAKAERTKAPALLHRDLTLVERILRDLLSPDFRSVRMDQEIEYEHTLEFVSRFQPSLIGHVKLYMREAPLFEEFGIQEEIDRALKPKVWLKSGGYIVINQTEALVAIDVNTGKYVGRTNRLEDTIVKTNIDAVKEIVRQIRLRDLGGIIVIDFIDMDERRNRTKVVQALDEALRQDRAPTKILSFNEFGLVALTRKRVKQSLERTLCEPCPYCSGAGWIKSVATMSSEIASEARKMASQIDGDVMRLRVHPEVASTLKSHFATLLSEIESQTRKELVIKSDPNVHQERFEIY
ncbi:MAG TPA: Rne/Rng family ribonuclease [Terriglobia bacterium]|nr:Rne/Rng family ribonuclease [Terriglobia bacterium]